MLARCDAHGDGEFDTPGYETTFHIWKVPGGLGPKTLPIRKQLADRVIGYGTPNRFQLINI